MISRTRGVGGGLWRSLECPSAAGPPPRQCTVQSRSRRPEAGAVLWSVHRPTASGTRKRSGARPGGQARLGAVASLTGAASFLRRPPARPEPFSGCGLEGCPRGHKPRGAPSTLPLLTQVPACAGGVRCRDNSTYTGVHAYLFLFFRKKKSFSCFSSFCFFVFLRFFFFFKLFRPGSR